MKQFFLKTTLFLFALTLSNCEKNDPQDQLPPITQTGENTFGCIINGEVLIPQNGKGSLSVTPKRGITAKYLSNNNFIIDAGNFKDSNGNRIYIYIYNLTSTGVYNFELSNGESTSTFEPLYPHCWSIISQNSKYISDINTGTITITRFDNNIISGVFSKLTLVNIDSPNDIIEITNGRFDINLNTVNK
ncbi:hypothetical protein [Polaribacter cellanae]|uniref:Uncharacterized protein n=1 Tax=Polaribacter cellanae TaxID=2818493 RepID=A0A975CVD9_9FLAO|nr:hypothetical protein [Polaribacter cellanae]QTE24296.1 hypothetical protein J3359_08560 [Polaribacter cellanae]